VSFIAPLIEDTSKEVSVQTRVSYLSNCHGS